MGEKIELQKKTVEYTLRRNKRSKRLRLSVACGGLLTVTAPLSMRASSIDEFIHKKAEWVLDRLEYFRQFPKKTVIHNKRKHFIEHKEKARALVRERLQHFNRFYGLSWNSISIRNQRSRWGSCSRKRNLSFNYKLALLPKHLADYVIVHELCHIKEMNHSKSFWDLVAKTAPEHKVNRKELRRLSASLM